MKNLTNISSKLLVVVISLSFLACGNNGNNTNDRTAASGSNKGQAWVEDNESKPNILQIAKQSEDHTTLAKAIQAAEIQNVLVNAGPLTVFAPTNEAFEQLPDGTLEKLMKPENKSKLANILTSHASPASLSQKQLKDGMQVYLATGQYVQSKVKDGDLYIKDARVLGSVDASNGKIHVIDKVLLVE